MSWEEIIWPKKVELGEIRDGIFWSTRKEKRLEDMFWSLLFCIYLDCGHQLVPNWDNMWANSSTVPTSDTNTTVKVIQPGSCHLYCFLLWGEVGGECCSPALALVHRSYLTASSKRAFGHAPTSSPHMCAWRLHAGRRLLRSKVFLRAWQPSP